MVQKLAEFDVNSELNEKVAKSSHEKSWRINNFAFAFLCSYSICVSQISTFWDIRNKMLCEWLKKANSIYFLILYPPLDLAPSF